MSPLYCVKVSNSVDYINHVNYRFKQKHVCVCMNGTFSFKGTSVKNCKSNVVLM